jgi:hypothetical protein
MVKRSILEQQILLTLAYSDQFQYPLTEAELWQRLLQLSALSWSRKSSPAAQSPQLPRAAERTKKDFSQQLKKLQKEGVISHQGSFLFLQGHESFISIRQKRQQYASSKWQEVAQVIRFARQVPWIQAVFITGSLAMENCEQDDDVDFLIVTQPQRLWLSRLILSIFAQLKHKRRTWSGEEKNSWCFNLWLSSNNLEVEERKQGVYRAYEVLQAKPVLSKNGTAEQFYRQNVWIKKFLPNAILKIAPMKETTATQSSFLRSLLDSVIDAVDWGCWHFQLWYMRTHRTSEKIDRNFAFFHPRDTEKLITGRWRSAVTHFPSHKELDKFFKKKSSEVHNSS